MAFLLEMDPQGSGSGSEPAGNASTGVVVIPGDLDNLGLCAIITVLLQMTFYVVACTCKVDTVTDFAGSGNFVILAVLTFALSGSYNARQILLTVLVVLWGVRLATYLLVRIIKIGKDSRFDKIRENRLAFLVFWLFQILWVYTVSLPVIFVNSPVSLQADIGVLGIIGAIIFFIGLLLETVADFHKFIFKLNADNAGKWCDVGLWKVTRHPNYLGEIVLWWGVFLISAEVLQGGKWVAVISPVFVGLILLFFTGIPPLEKSADTKHGKNPDYISYKQSTPPLIPAVPVLYRQTPYWLKLIFCLEFPFYSYAKEEQPIQTGGTAEEGEGRRKRVQLQWGASFSSTVPEITPTSSNSSHHFHNIQP